MSAPITLYCKDCQFGSFEAHPVYRQWYCAAPQAQRDLVNGRLPLCADVRSAESVCGLEGKLFHPKPPQEPEWIVVESCQRSWWQRLGGRA